MKGCSKSSNFGNYLSGISGYNPTGADVYSVEQNLLNVVDNRYYFPQSYESGLDYNKTVGGKINTVGSLFSNESLNPYPSNYSDYYNILTY